MVCQLFLFLFLSFVNLTEAQVIWEEGISINNIHPQDWPVDKSEEHVLDS